MNKSQKNKVAQYLHSIKRTEIAIYNLSNSIENLETRRNSPPTWMQVPGIGGGGDSGSKQEAWVEFLDTYDARKSYLQDKLEEHRLKVVQYNDVLTALSEEGQIGMIASYVIRHKYYDKVAPDSEIYTNILFCSESTFYKAHRFGLIFFFEALPDIFIR